MIVMSIQRTMIVFRLMFIIVLLFDFTLSNSSEDDDSAAEQLRRILENRIRCYGESIDITQMLGSDENSTEIYDDFEMLTTTTTTTTKRTKPLKKTHCEKEFDGILCWGETPAGQNAYLQCPDWFIGFQNKKEKAMRTCEPDGTWKRKPNSNNSYTNYKPCIEDLDAKLLDSHLWNLKLIAKVGSYLSMTSLILAIIILSSFKRLHCSRNALHINLFSSFLLFSILQLIKETFWLNSIGFPKDLIPISENRDKSINRYVMNPNISHWECKTVMAMFRYAESSNHATVFSEALYLNALLSVSTFNDSDHLKFYIAIGWIGPLIWIIPFVIVMAIHHEYNSCWTSETGFSFFYVVPQVLLIFLNFALFINTLRVLKNKLRKNNLTDANNSKRYRKLAKSTLLCGFSFSIYYIAFSVWQPFVKGKLPVVLDLIRLYFEFICGSFQGLAISCIYCFFNSEVQAEILTQIERVLISRNPNMRRFSQAPNMRDRISSVSLRSHRSTNVTKISNNLVLSKSSQIDSNDNHNHLKNPNNWDQLLPPSPNSTVNGAAMYASSNNGTVNDSLLVHHTLKPPPDPKTVSNWSKLANLMRKKQHNAAPSASKSSSSTILVRTSNNSTTCPNRSEFFMQKSPSELNKDTTTVTTTTDLNNNTNNNNDNDNQIKTMTTTTSEYSVASEEKENLCNGNKSQLPVVDLPPICINHEDDTDGEEEEETKLVDGHDVDVKKPTTIATTERKSAMRQQHSYNDAKSPKSPKNVVSFSFSKNATFDKSDPNELKNLLIKNE